MTRAEADAVLREWLDARETAIAGAAPAVAMAATLRASAIHERILDAMTGEEATQPLAGRAP